MRRLWAASLGALLVIAVTVSILLRHDPLEYSATSYGTVPDAYGALHDMLAALDVPVRRSTAAPERLDPGITVWWIEPREICWKLGRTESEAQAPAGRAQRAAAERRRAPARLGSAWDPAPWIRAGGTAVLFAASLADCKKELRIAGLVLPVPRRPGAEIDGTRESDASDEPDDLAAAPEMQQESEPQLVTGSLVRNPRSLPVPELAAFDAVPDGFEVIASVGGAAFALEARIGAGRLVVAADSLFLRNRWLDRGDAAPLAFDWVRAYGVPHFDEREHGLNDTPSTLAYLAGSPALPVFLGLTASGVLFGWMGSSLPRRRVGDERPVPPTLATYVDSLAGLYARAGDHPEVFERYRAYGLAELRRALRLAHDAPAEQVQDALRGRPGVAASDLAALRGEVAVRGPDDLDAACGAVDRLLARLR